MGFLIPMWVSKSTGFPKCSEVLLCFFNGCGMRVLESGLGQRKKNFGFWAIGFRFPSFPLGVSRSTGS